MGDEAESESGEKKECGLLLLLLLWGTWSQIDPPPDPDSDATVCGASA